MFFPPSALWLKLFVGKHGAICFAGTDSSKEEAGLGAVDPTPVPPCFPPTTAELAIARLKLAYTGVKIEPGHSAAAAAAAAAAATCLLTIYYNDDDANGDDDDGDTADGDGDL